MEEEKRTLFECDPEKNKDCRKTACFINGGECHQTQHLKYAKVTHPSGYADLQKKQTTDIYARIKLDSCIPANMDARIRKIFMTRLRARAHHQGMTQRVLAQKTGLSENTISLLFRGKVMPSAQSLVRIAIVLRCSSDYLLGLKGAEVKT